MPESTDPRSGSTSFLESGAHRPYILPPGFTCESCRRRPARTVRSAGTAWSWRHGRGVSRARYEAQSRRGAEDPAGHAGGRSRLPGPIQTRIPVAGVAQPREHRGGLRLRGCGQCPRHRDGARRRRGPRRADRAGTDPGRRGAGDRAAARRRSRGRTRARDHPPRFEAGEHQAAARWNGEGSGLRPGEGARPHARRVRRQRDGVADALDRCHPGRRHPRHGGLHEPRAGSGSCRGPARGHLGVWRRALRDADGTSGVRRGDGLRQSGVRDHEGAGLGGIASECPERPPSPAGAMSDERPADAAARHRRGSRGHRRAGPDPRE